MIPKYKEIGGRTHVWSPDAIKCGTGHRNHLYHTPENYQIGGWVLTVDECWKILNHPELCKNIKKPQISH